MYSYRRKWNVEYAVQVDASLIASDGEKFAVHASALKSPILAGKGRFEFPIDATSCTVNAILQIAYNDEYDMACSEASVRELLEVLVVRLDSTTLYRKLACRFHTFLRACALKWRRGDTGIPNDFLMVEGRTNGLEVDRFVEICVAFLNFYNPWENELQVTDFEELDAVVNVFRTFVDADVIWDTVMSHPLWETVSQPLLTKFVSSVTTARTPMTRAPNATPRQVSVTVPITPDDFKKPFVKSVPLDSRWELKCSNNGYFDTINLFVECKEGGRASRIEAILLEPHGPPPFNRLALCCRGGYRGFRLQEYGYAGDLGEVTDATTGSFTIHATITEYL